METTLYVVIREGVYDQGVFGVYETPSLAIDAVRVARKLERDEYHDFDIRRIILNSHSISEDGHYPTNSYEYPKESTY